MPWAITFPEGARGAPAGIPLHPTQIYEILIIVIIMIVFLIFRSEKWKGTKLLWFIVLYGLGRAATDLLRGDLDNSVYVGPFTLSQLICLVAAVVSIILLFFYYLLFLHKTK